MYKTYVDVATFNCEWCPWIPGLSFMTDGIQCKLPLVSVRNNRTPGLDCLYDRGFTGFKRENPLKQINISSVRNGVYVHGKQDISLNRDELKNHIFLGFDPGRNKPVSVSTIDGANMPFDWSDEKRIYTLDKSIQRNEYISNDEYRIKTGSKQQELYEKKRRAGEYAEALAKFNNTKCKSGIVSENTSYYNARLSTWNVIRKEMLQIQVIF